ncbi:leucyl/phenylalanyl-tRNA--protein transferase [Halomonas sp. TRM85114]|uniref:leucyl/phenylalanyl-tRNA--protein transferase n=1 Tax=Halomonas jincaotanensis TaxID=2810616 RepID=UPI001BD41599|nr:leucyl/phenylalanyl-tRNA--protein transferase [Halomonas jincaotanensis]MBS9404438.1 leucyl/phenylalanyl-tRNA--protein transferase [Halomonas jincaotanensis]
MLPWLADYPVIFPPVELALRDPDGLLAAGGDLSPAWLLAAYRRGIFPWYGDDQPILWWSPDPRMVLFPSEMRVRRSLAKRARNGGFRVSADRAFPHVVAACAAPRPGQPGTWITAEMSKAYEQLHALGAAHSVEVWHDGRLIGGLYGIAMGPVFFGESMFSHQPDASKIALMHLTDAMQGGGGKLIDCQMHTSHLASLGARGIARAEFIGYLKKWLGDENWPGELPSDGATGPGVIPPTWSFASIGSAQESTSGRKPS